MVPGIEGRLPTQTKAYKPLYTNNTMICDKIFPSWQPSIPSVELMHTSKPIEENLGYLERMSH